MIWYRLEWESWTVGCEFQGYMSTAHIGPLKVSWIVRGSQLYSDFQNTRNIKDGEPKG